MIKTITPAVMAVSLLAAGLSAPAFAQTPPSAPTAYEVVKSQYAANARGDLDGMLGTLAPDVHWTEMEGFPYHGTYIGKQAIVDNVVKRVGSEWDDYTFTLDRLIDAGEVVVGIGRYSGTYRKTGKFMTARVAHVWEVKDGKINRFEQFADTLLIDRAVTGAR